MYDVTVLWNIHNLHVIICVALLHAIYIRETINIDKARQKISITEVYK